MNTLKTKINNYLSKYSIFIFAIITFALCMMHTPFWDETHAFEIARLNLSEIFQILKIEGHTFLWYLIIKPFSNLDLYPYSMYIINWLFCLISLIILWKRAPFSPIQKTFITFSVPFFLYYSIIARCYSIGILFLFLICANYKKRFKKPILYSLLIILCANTSILAMIGVFYLGLIYLFEILSKYKNNKFSKKNLIFVLLIFTFGAFIILAQFWGIKTKELEHYYWIIETMLSFILIPFYQNIFMLALRVLCIISFYYFNFIAFKNSKKALFFFHSTFITLFLLFFTSYSGNFWNYFIYFVYIIVLFWIYKKQLLCNKFSKILFNCLLFFMIFPHSLFDDGKMQMIYDAHSKEIAQQILQNENYKKAKLYTLEWWSDISPGANIYLAKHNVYIYDLRNRKKTSYESLKEIFKLRDELIDFDVFYKEMDKNSYLVATKKLLDQKFVNLFVSEENGDLLFVTKSKKYLLKLIEKNEKIDLNIYKISEI